MNLLQQKIKEASQKYYTTGESDLTDEEFDKLLEAERKANPESELLKVGHGYEIQKDKTYGEKVKHKYGIVGSLPKCKTYKEFISLYKDLSGATLMASTKLDGLSAVLYFEEGKLVDAVTRGDGTTGISVCDKIKYITHIDRCNSSNFTGAIRGEIIMSLENWEKFHRIHPEAKHPRNSVAGLMNNKTVTSDLDYVDVVFYTVVGSENVEFSTYTDVFDFLSEELPGQKIAKHEEFSIVNTTDDEKLNTYMDSLKDKWYGDYPYDGIVVAYSTLKVSGNSVSYISNAYKFKSESKISEVVDIDWNLSKTGNLVPRIQINPIELSGATVSYCAVHNAQNVRDIKIGIGSKVRITRSNEVIPYLEEVISEKDYTLPTTCPSCGCDLEWNGVHLQCKNTECKNSEVQDTLIWFNNLVPVDGLGDVLILKYLEQMLGEDNISIENIYAHGPIVDTSSPYVKETLFNETFNKLFEGPFDLSSAIQALNIARFGDITSVKLAEYGDEIKMILEKNIIPESLKILGAANFESLCSNLSKLKRLDLIKDMIQWDSSGAEYRGDVCITGKLSVKRSIFESELKEAGFAPVSSVKKDTFCLITDDPNSGSSKNKNADKYNIPKFSESEFRLKYM